MSKALHNSELNYTIMEKQACSLVKSLMHFRTYVGYSKIVGYVPHSAVKDILAQQDCLGVRGKWVSKIREYDLEIKPTKLVKGQGLAWMLAEGNEQALGIVSQSNSPVVSTTLQKLKQHDWYYDPGCRSVPPPPPGPDPRSALRAGASRNHAPSRAPALPNRAPDLLFTLPTDARTSTLPLAPGTLPPMLPNLQHSLPNPRNRALGALPNPRGRSPNFGTKK
jgi:hypothetical protein